MTGGTIAHYRVLEKIGEGGMGVVWKARDTRLNRQVAIKVLASSKAGIAERRARLIQEAKAASALNHPNIITIYEIGEDEGAPYIAMEYVEGRTLDALIGARGMKIGDVLKYSAQIADALAAAHRAGIVHRDLKPSNVIVAGTGIVKVLDFGLAKLTELAPLSPEADTLTVPPKTEEGTILGTVSYMSPEQAEGRPLDRRSDIFSLGSMMYEMVSGRRPFEGDTKLAILSAILHAEPEAVGGVPAPGGREVERIIRRCMRKDPAARYQHMDDLKIVLLDLKEESDSGSYAQPSAAMRVENLRRRWIGAASTGAVVALVLTFGAWWWLRRSESAAPAQVATATRMTFDTGLTTDPDYWPGGNMIVYASDRATGTNLDIWIQHLNGERRQLTTDAADDHEPSFSPDGSKVVFRSDREGGGVYVISTLGGGERKLAGGGHYPHYSPNGKWIAYTVGDIDSSLSLTAVVIPAEGGPPRPLCPSMPFSRFVAWSPDGRYVLLLAADKEHPSISLYVQPAAGGKLADTGLRNVSGQGAWAGDEIVFGRTGGETVPLWSWKLDPATFQVRGEPRRLTAGIGIDSSPVLAAGRLIYAGLEYNNDLWMVPVDGESGRTRGEPVRLTQELGSDAGPAVAEDGTRLAWLSVRGDRTHVIAKDLASGTSLDLASFPAQVRQAASISPDGAWVAYNVGNRPFDGVAYRIPFQGGRRKSSATDAK